MANEGSIRMTTAELKAMIAGGATRSQLPTKAGGGSVSSTRESANIAYLAAVNRARETAEFRTAQTQTARTISKARTAQMISVSENTTNMPSYDAQSQKFNNSISNNNVNPAALFTPQPVNNNNNSQNSSVSGGINANANYNYATQMNDFQTANPTGQVNMGESAQAWGYTGGKSSIPIDNEVKTSLLGGDIQHQESDINTNVSYLPEMNDPQDTISTLPYSPINLGGVGIAIAGLGALLLMGKF